MAVFMSKRPLANQTWPLASAQLLDAYTDFILSRQAMQCSPATHCRALKPMRVSDGSIETIHNNSIQASMTFWKGLRWAIP